MKLIQNSMVGVDQGAEMLFSHCEENGEMWVSEGARECRVGVRFATKFRDAPSVHVSFDMFDMDRSTNQRADISAANISDDGFEIVFKTWGDTKIARARAAWLAIGAVRDTDAWDV